MFDMISMWVKNVIFIVLFAVFLEFLLPRSNMQRFVRVIMGLFIMLAILNPVVELMQHPWRAEETMLAMPSSNGQTAQILAETRKTAQAREQLTLELYERDMARQIQATVEAVDGVAGAQVSVRASLVPEHGPVKIESVKILIRPGNHAAQAPIRKIVIDKAPAKEENKIDLALKRKIQNIIVQLYQLRPEQIQIETMPD
ncbi:spore iii af: stage iii sporulation protein af [Lucifera butyrica]|uniref:Spore iii af: stage iii sporulation protein af n=1 Tax=Lucifera butyrica TaxID=1351585 RepID=A0A498RAX4_9FIRM|nr:stage III sporulation protein AF [Lucifera butyrica]VBB08017.1 spore iii af: stage iii sporulation protein af [Lucifera butyrica]